MEDKKYCIYRHLKPNGIRKNKTNFKFLKNYYYESL